MRARVIAVLFVLAFVPAVIDGQGTKPTPPKPTPTPTPQTSKPKPTPTPTPQASKPSPPAAPPSTQTAAPKPALTVPSVSTQAPPGYVIGPDDILVVVVWREKDMSGEVAVRPDGKISLPLLNDVQAAGLTPEELRLRLTEAARKFVETPEVTVVVKLINSRKVFITGQVTKPGPYPLAGPTTVLQLIATAGGLLEYADDKNIVILRTEFGKPTSYRFNYREVVRRVNLNQNIELKPGDTVVVP